MKRREFLAKLGIGVSAVAVADKILDQELTLTQELIDQIENEEIQAAMDASELRTSHSMSTDAGYDYHSEMKITSTSSPYGTVYIKAKEEALKAHRREMDKAFLFGFE